MLTSGKMLNQIHVAQDERITRGQTQLLTKPEIPYFSFLGRLYCVSFLNADIVPCVSATHDL